MSSAAPAQAPRPPTAEELRQLADWLCTHGHDPADAAGIAASGYVAVYDRYGTGGPGYNGKLMSVVWDGAPSFFDVFTWEDGVMVRSGRDYDDKACDRCNAGNASLCFNCWRHVSAGWDRDRHDRVRSGRAANPILGTLTAWSRPIRRLVGRGRDASDAGSGNPKTGDDRVDIPGSRS